MKIRKVNKNGRIKIFVIDYDSNQYHDIDPESWEFFEMVSLDVIEFFSGKLQERYDGSDASRWVCHFNSKNVYFDFDDMLGMNISFDANVKDIDLFVSLIYEYLSSNWE